MGLGHAQADPTELGHPSPERGIVPGAVLGLHDLTHAFEGRVLVQKFPDLHAEKLLLLVESEVHVGGISRAGWSASVPGRGRPSWDRRHRRWHPYAQRDSQLSRISAADPREP